jgi:hypothetical protein
VWPTLLGAMGMPGSAGIPDRRASRLRQQGQASMERSDLEPRGSGVGAWGVSVAETVVYFSRTRLTPPPTSARVDALKPHQEVAASTCRAFPCENTEGTGQTNAVSCEVIW